MKKSVSIVLAVIMCLSVLTTAALGFTEEITGLTWDGKPATMTEIAKHTGYDFIDSDGNYKPMYAYNAEELWKDGLFLGSNGSFDLNKPLTRAEGTVMILRILGKEDEAKTAKLTSGFTDVPDWAAYQVAYAADMGLVKGYSDTRFGSSDPMQSNQFITLVLRAMGYEDDVDFTWDKPWAKALEIGLIGEGCFNQYSRSNLFLRDNVAILCHNALHYAPMKSGGQVIDTITVPGRPSGSVPVARRYENEPAPPSPGPEEPGPADPGNEDDISIDSQGKVTVWFDSGSYSGDISIESVLTCSNKNLTKYTIKSSNSTPIRVEANKTYCLTYEYEYNSLIPNFGISGMNYKGTWVEFPADYKVNVTITLGDREIKHEVKRNINSLLEEPTSFDLEAK